MQEVLWFSDFSGHKSLHEDLLKMQIPKDSDSANHFEGKKPGHLR